MITFTCWKWSRPKTGYQLPQVCEYTVEHVNTLYSMLSRHMSKPFRLVCITDTITDHFCEGVIKTCYPSPSYSELGGCYRRLVQFNHAVSDRWMMLDLDCVITDDLVPLVRELEQYDFAMNRYWRNNNKPRQHYNGALQWHTAVARPEVWQKFLGKPSAKAIERDRQLVGTDQAWISHVLGPGEKTVGPEDGVYDISQIGDKLPADARIVFFPGAHDPSVSQYDWVREYYR